MKKLITLLSLAALSQAYAQEASANRFIYEVPEAEYAQEETERGPGNPGNLPASPGNLPASPIDQYIPFLAAAGLAAAAYGEKKMRKA